MVTVALAGTRQKLDTTLALALTFEDATTVAAGSTGIDLPVVIDSLALDQVTISDVDTTISSMAISSVGGGFSALKVGMVLSGNANIPGGAVITAITDDNNATIDQNATATATASTDFDGTFDATAFVIRITLVQSGSSVRITPSIAKLNGTSVADITGGADGLGYADGTATVLSAQTFDADSYLTNVGVAKKNS